MTGEQGRKAVRKPYFSRTKVTPPVSSRFEVPRQAILEQVYASSARIVLVHAPAGVLAKPPS